MGKTPIEWTEESWNPIGGCRKVSPGCKECYAIRVARRLGGNPNPKVRNRYAGLTVIQNGAPNWSGKTFIDDDVLREPLLRREPTTYFISLSDLFFDERPDQDIDRVLTAMALCCPPGCSNRFNFDRHAEHRFLVLTKYHDRMRDYFARLAAPRDRFLPDRIMDACHQILRQRPNDSRNISWDLPGWPLSNVGLGVSVEDQQRADERIPVLLQTPAAMRFVSAEPLLGPVHLAPWLIRRNPNPPAANWDMSRRQSVDWVIAGGESGPGARPVQAAWIRSLRDQCQAAGIPFFFKQWGAWLPDCQNSEMTEEGRRLAEGTTQALRVGKKSAGALLDGREWRDLPAFLRRAA